MKDLKLKGSPRLFVDEDTLVNLRAKLHGPYLKHMAEGVLRDADRLVRAAPIAGPGEHDFLRNVRILAGHLRCLTAAWILERKPKYRGAAMRHLTTLMGWDHISCWADCNTPPDKKMPFGLSYGQLSADIGLMYDVLRPDMTTEEQKVFFDVLNRFCMEAALRAIDTPPWWAFKGWSNWNGVCSGGIGMMALAVYDDMPEARRLIPFVEKSLDQYFSLFVESGGGCHEGTGYWNYGMQYAVPYLLSWENATGRRHPAFRIKELGKSLFFPLDFTGLTFGDNDGWGPGGFYFLMAKRLNMPAAALQAATHLVERSDPKKTRDWKGVVGGGLLYAAESVPTAAAMKELKARHKERKTPVARVYKGLDWAALADDEVFPRLRLTARGGSSEIRGHGHLDLLSFKCMVNGERMITDQAGGGTAVTFTSRGHELYDRSPASKSTLFVDGLGCRTNAVCDVTEVVKGKDILGIRIDGSHIYLKQWRDMFIGRLFLMVEGSYWLVIDRVFSPNTAEHHFMESRFHTYADARRGRRSGSASRSACPDGRGKDWVALKSGKQRMTMTFAALGDAVMQEAVGTPARPARQTTMFRWMSAEGYHDNLHVTALNPGSGRLRLAVTREKGSGFGVKVTGPGGYRCAIRLTSSLKLKK